MTSENLDKKDREISLLDLMVTILLKWRGILISGIIGAFLFGIFGYFLALQDVKTQNRVLQEQQLMIEQQSNMTEQEANRLWEDNRDQLAKQLDARQLMNVNTAIAYKQYLEEKLEYQKNSLLMQVDPSHVQKTDLTFLVRADDSNNVATIGNIYRNLITSASLYDYVQKECNLESQVDELIYLRNSGDVELSKFGYDLQLNIQQNNESNILDIEIISDQAALSEAMADAVEKFIMEKSDYLQTTLGTHQIILINRSQGEIVDTDVANRQKECVQDLNILQTAYNALMLNFTTEQLNYYNFLTAEQDSGQNADVQIETNIAPAHLNIKYIIIGSLLCMVVYVLIVFVNYILNDKIRSSDDLQNFYSIPKIGELFLPMKKHLFGNVDQRLLDLVYRGKKKCGEEESILFAATSLKIEAQKKNLQHIYFIGSTMPESVWKACNKIKDILKAEQIEISILDDVLYNANELERLANAETAVLVGNVGITTYDEIIKETLLLNREHINILGYIMAV